MLHASILLAPKIQSIRLPLQKIGLQHHHISHLSVSLSHLFSFLPTSGLCFSEPFDHRADRQHHSLFLLHARQFRRNLKTNHHRGTAVDIWCRGGFDIPSDAPRPLFFARTKGRRAGKGLRIASDREGTMGELRWGIRASRSV